MGRNLCGELHRRPCVLGTVDPVAPRTGICHDIPSQGQLHHCPALQSSTAQPSESPPEPPLCLVVPGSQLSPAGMGRTTDLRASRLSSFLPPAKQGNAGCFKNTQTLPGGPPASCRHWARHFTCIIKPISEMAKLRLQRYTTETTSKWR